MSEHTTQETRVSILLHPPSSISNEGRDFSQSLDCDLESDGSPLTCTPGFVRQCCTEPNDAPPWVSDGPSILCHCQHSDTCPHSSLTIGIILGMTAYFVCCLPQCSSVTATLRQLFAPNLEKLKMIFITSPTLAHFQLECPTLVT